MATGDDTRPIKVAAAIAPDEICPPVRGIVDAHTHVFSPEVIAGRSAYLKRETWFQQLYENPRSRLAGGDDLLASMAEAGIEQAIACGFPWRDLGICREHNDYLADTAARSGGRISWMAIVPPPVGRGAVVEARRAFERGAVAVGELNSDAQGFDLRDAVGLAPLVGICRELGRPVMLHSSEPVGHDYPGKGSATPEKLLAFARAFPDLSIVLAHWGGGLPFYELMPEVATALRRVVYDSAASTYLYRFEVFRAVLDIVGPDRVLFASDYPVLSQGRFLRRVVESNLWSDELPTVLGGAARRVYGLTSLADVEGGVG